MNGYTNIIYLAAAVLVVFAAILVIHFIAGSRKMERNHKLIPLYCGAVFLVGVGALVFLAHSAQSSDTIEGYSPFGPSELSRAGILLSEPVSDSGSLDSEVYISGMNLAFNDGKFLDIRFDAFCSGEQRPFQVTGSGKLYPGTSSDAPAEPEDAVPLSILLSAFVQLENIDWLDKLGLPDGGALVLSTAEHGAAAAPGGSTYLLRNDELLPVKDMDNIKLPTLVYTAGEQSGCIYLGEAL